MRPFLARFSEPVWSGRLPSWADFITTTPELKFSVHTSDIYGMIQPSRHCAIVGYVFCGNSADAGLRNLDCDIAAGVTG
jgi:hypothetical protein